MQSGDKGHQQQLAELPLPAMEALLRRDDLRVASENTVVAAVKYWLKQEGRRQTMSALQLQQLAYGLRLQHCTICFLAHVLGNEHHWLYKALTPTQRSLLLSFGKQHWMDFVSSPLAPTYMFHGFPAPVAWCSEPRQLPDSGKTIILTVSARRRDQAPGDTHIACDPVFFNGIEWMLVVRFKAEEEELAAASTGAQQVYALKCYVRRAGATLEPWPAHLVANLSFIGSDGRTMWADTVTPGLTDGLVFWKVRDCSFISLADVNSKLGPFVHADGKLHLKAELKGP